MKYFRFLSSCPLSCPQLFTIAPLPWHALIVSLWYQSLCRPSQAFTGGGFPPFSYKPVCLLCSVWILTSNLPVVVPSHACVRNREEEEVDDAVVVCFLNSAVETFPQLACASPKGCHYLWWMPKVHFVSNHIICWILN